MVESRNNNIKQKMEKKSMGNQISIQEKTPESTLENNKHTAYV